MNSLSDEELNYIVNAVVEKLTSENPGRLHDIFVSNSVCNERYSFLKIAVLGLYALVGTGFTAVLTVLLSK